MANPRKQEFDNDRADQSNVEDFEYSSYDASSDDGSAANFGNSRENRDSRRGTGLTERLADVLVDEGDGGLLLQQSGQDMFMQWLQALDLQVVGACRADERLKPLLKVNASSGACEDRLLAHLSQHFEPSEVGILARCFCVPLVSIRVGKIDKQGTLLCPTSTRGNLNLTLLPTSDLRLTFVGDDSNTERLFTLSSKAQCEAVAIEEILADNSGRSFLLRVPDGNVFYFWCSEKSKLLGCELLLKMKDILKKKPSIAELTGISESRLGCFATQLRAYLTGSSTVTTIQPTAVFGSSPFSNTSAGTVDTSRIVQSSFAASRPSRTRHANSSASLSPRSNSFKEGTPRNLSSRGSAREKLRRRGDSHLSAVDNYTVSPVIPDALDSKDSENGHIGKSSQCCPLSQGFLELPVKIAVPPTLGPASDISSSSTFLSPYYCWCPPGGSTLQFSAVPSKLTTSYMESIALPPLASLLPATRSSTLLATTPPLSLADVPVMDFPSLLPDPIMRLPIPSSQQIPTFTPLMCDPIVHIPVIDVCTSGQGYLVSAGPAISTTIPPLHPQLVNPLIPKTDSLVEEGARETLRLLISKSGQNNSQLIDVLPAVLSKTNEEHLFVAGSRGLYSGTGDVDISGIAGRRVLSESGMPVGSRALDKCNLNNANDLPETSNALNGSCSENRRTM